MTDRVPFAEEQNGPPPQGGYLPNPMEELTAVRRLLCMIGENPDREGLQDTPQRFLAAWHFYTKGYKEDPGTILKTFEDGSEDYDQMIFQRNIPVYSHCEHHLAPFFGVAHIGYLPEGRVVGLSKLSRLVDVFARRLQIQERLTSQIAKALQEHLKPKGVGVVIECRHWCMECRGVQKANVPTTTTALQGLMKTDESAKAEFLQYVHGGR